MSPPPPPRRPHFFVRLALPDTNGSEPLPDDECWRVRWHKTSRTRDLPVVEPKFGTMPAIVWVKAFLRTYAVAESQQMLQEVYDNLPPQYHIVKEKPRHRVVVLGDMGVGKTTLIKTFCAGKPEEQEFVATPRGSKSGGASATAAAGDDVVRRTTKERAYPTVTARSFQTSVKKPGSEEMLDLEVWDTSGQERFKPLSLAFFRNAACVILVFDVRDRRTFDSLGRIGGWRDEFTRMTGATPKTFPFILVGNKIESDIQKPRQVWEDDRNRRHVTPLLTPRIPRGRCGRTMCATGARARAACCRSWRRPSRAILRTRTSTRRASSASSRAWRWGWRRRSARMRRRTRCGSTTRTKTRRKRGPSADR